MHLDGVASDLDPCLELLSPVPSTWSNRCAESGQHKSVCRESESMLESSGWAVVSCRLLLSRPLEKRRVLELGCRRSYRQVDLPAKIHEDGLLDIRLPLVMSDKVGQP